jgi:hypothetical protein
VYLLKVGGANEFEANRKRSLPAPLPDCPPYATKYLGVIVSPIGSLEVEELLDEDDMPLTLDCEDKELDATDDAVDELLSDDPLLAELLLEFDEDETDESLVIIAGAELPAVPPDDPPPHPHSVLNAHAKASICSGLT